MKDPTIPKFYDSSLLPKEKYIESLYSLEKKLVSANQLIKKNHISRNSCFKYIQKREVDSSFLLKTLGNPSLQNQQVQEDINNYISTLSYGIDSLNKKGSLSSQLICLLHAKLTSVGRGSQYSPGKFRDTQNWIGGIDGNIDYTPPRPTDIPHLMQELDAHIKKTASHPIVHISFIYLQFLSIHPFTDGNGRIARLLVSLLFVTQSLVISPFISIHYFINKNRRQYERCLKQGRDENPLKWVLFFFEAIEFSIIDFLSYCETHDLVERRKNHSAVRF